MRVCFADTSYYVALLLEEDSRHVRASELTKSMRGRFVTSTWVLAELGNFMSPAHARMLFVNLVRGLRADPDVTIIDPTAQQFQSGLDLYASRPDKDWSMVDCISFHIMRDMKITEAFTTDHHFEQAGFAALLK